MFGFVFLLANKCRGDMRRAGLEEGRGGGGGGGEAAEDVGWFRRGGVGLRTR